jgi:nitronate monooxygenase
VARRIAWPDGWTIRTLANDFTRRWAGDVDALRADEGELARYDRARAEGDFDTAAVIAGEAADLVRGIEPAGAIVERIVAEAEALLAGAPDRLTSA